MSKISDYIYEIVFGTICIIIAIILPKIGVSEDIAWLIGFLSIIIPITSSSLKLFITKSIKRALKNALEGPSSANSISFLLSQMLEPKLSYARSIWNNAVEQITKINRGVITLSESEYFDEIITETQNLKGGNKVFAVNSFDERRFTTDPREINYFEENLLAINRGAIITRIFIFDDELQDNLERQERLKSIKMNIDNHINVFVVLKSSLNNIVLKNSLKGNERNKLFTDWVMFGERHQKLYIDYQDPGDKTRVSFGELNINELEIKEYRYIFRILKENKISDGSLLNLFNENGIQTLL